MRSRRNGDEEQQWQFAVMDGEHIVDLLPTAMEAAEVAGYDTSLVRANPYYEVGTIRDMDTLKRLTEGDATGADAFRKGNLPQVSGEEVWELTDGLTNPNRVFDLLKDHFTHLPHWVQKKYKADFEGPPIGPKYLGACWESADGLCGINASQSHKGRPMKRGAILSTNAKVNMEREGMTVEGTIMGLTLVPYWRNTQTEVVRQAKSINLLQQVEAGLDVRGSDPLAQTDNWCAGSSWACRRACLIATGNNYQAYNYRVKFAKAEALKAQPVAFCAALAMNCKAFQDMEAKKGRQAFIRMNMLSDIPWEIVFPDLFDMVPNAQFYDYSKINVHDRMVPRNYDLTFSYNGTNEEQCKLALEAGHRVAVVIVSADRSKSPGHKKSRIEFDEAASVFGGAMKHPFGAQEGALKGQYCKAIDRKLQEGEYEFVNGNTNDFRPVDPSPSVVFLSYKQPKGVSKQDLDTLRYKSKFAVPGNIAGLQQLNVVPVKWMGPFLVTAQVPLQNAVVPIGSGANLKADNAVGDPSNEELDEEQLEELDEEEAG